MEEFLNDHRAHNEKPSNEMLLKLLEFVLSMNNFEFNGEHFLQIFGTAIWTKVAPSYANLVMSFFEEKYVYTYILQMILWLRFTDDIFALWQHGLDS